MPFGRLGEVTGGTGEHIVASQRLTVHGLLGSVVIDVATADLKAAWQKPLRW